MQSLSVIMSCIHFHDVLSGNEVPGKNSVAANTHVFFKRIWIVQERLLFSREVRMVREDYCHIRSVSYHRKTD